MKRTYLIGAGVAVIGTGVLIYRNREAVINKALDLVLPVQEPKSQALVDSQFMLYIHDVIERLTEISKPVEHLTDAVTKHVENHLHSVRSSYDGGEAANHCARRLLSLGLWHPADPVNPQR